MVGGAPTTSHAARPWTTILKNSHLNRSRFVRYDLLICQGDWFARIVLFQRNVRPREQFSRDL